MVICKGVKRMNIWGILKQLANKKNAFREKLKSFFIEERKYLWFVMSTVHYIRGSLRSVL